MNLGLPQHARANALFLAVLFCAACSEDPDLDSGSSVGRDAQSTDASALDGDFDAGPLGDATSSDGDTISDAGSALDAGAVDAGPLWCGTSAHGEIQTRECFSWPSVPVGQTCTSTTQSRTCDHGVWSPDWPLCDYFSCGPGAYMWSRRFGSTQEDFGYDVVMDAADNAFVAAGYEGLDPAPDFYIDASAADGSRNWYGRYGGTAADEAFGIAIDGAGNLFVTGYAFSSSADLGGGLLPAGRGLAVASYENDGTHRWSFRVAGMGQNAGHAIVTDGFGNVYVTGVFEGDIDFGDGTVTSSGGTDIFVVSYDNDGVYRWSNTFGASADDAGLAITADSVGNVFVSGFFQGSVDLGGGTVTSSGAWDAFLVSYDVGGTYRWSRKFGDAERQRGEGLAMDSADNLFITGSFEGVADFGGGDRTSAGDWDIFLASYTTDGDHRWSERFGDRSDSYAHAVAVDGDGNVYITGKFNGRLDLGGGEMRGAGQYDIHVGSFAPDGLHRWSKSFGRWSGEERGLGIAVGSHVIVTGEVQSVMNFDGHHSPGWANDAFVLALVK